MTEVLMPALSPTMEEGTLAKWLVKIGDKVRAGDVIAEIETDKATMEVEAVDEGVVETLLVPEGTQGVKVNTAIARLSGGAPSAPVPPPAAPVSAPPMAGPVSQAASSLAPATLNRPAPPEAGAARVAASPLARRLAAQLGIALDSLSGSGPHGRIIRRDVEAKRGAAAKVETLAAPLGSVLPAEAKSLAQMGIEPGSYRLEPLDGMKKTVARRMSESARNVPQFPLQMNIEIDSLLETRAALNALLEPEGVKVSVNDLVIKAAASALKRVPAVNASYTPEGIAYHHHADIAVAVAIEGGLITPIIRSAEMKGVAEIAREAKDLAERARARKLKPQEYLGGTFSISNLGMFGISAFGSLVNEPQGAILSVGAGESRPVARGDQLAVATVMTVTLTCDHRVIDGATGAAWLKVFRAMIQSPTTMLA
jgi:pyruvate dehydrogenase E2 component (dihydrolipoamide acetyltransferase)